MIFRNQDMKAAVFEDVGLEDAEFTDVNLRGSSFRDADLSGATLTDVNLSGVTISNCRLDGATIAGFDIVALIEGERGRAAAASGSRAGDVVALGAAPFNDYDPFARAYDRHWGRDSRRALPIVDKLLLARLPRGARVLDLCCGTGQFLQALIERGYDVVGLDGSAAQLSYARRNAPDATLVHADAGSFSLASSVDGVVSLYDSLNHVMTLEELLVVFRNVHAALADGGGFVFDLNMAHKYETSWSGTFSFLDPDLVTIVRTNADLAGKVATFEAVIFDEAPPDGWRRSDVSLRQTWYSQDEVTRALEKAGFSDVEVHPRSEDKYFFSAIRRRAL